MRHFEWQKTHVDEWQKVCVRRDGNIPTLRIISMQLDAVAKARYREKLAMLGQIKDPYLPSEEQTASVQWNDWP